MAASMSAGGIGYGRSPLVRILSCLMNFSFYCLLFIYFHYFDLRLALSMAALQPE